MITNEMLVAAYLAVNPHLYPDMDVDQMADKLLRAVNALGADASIHLRRIMIWNSFKDELPNCRRAA